MKKILLSALLIGATVGATAQVAVLKEAERAMKGGKTAAEVITVITPAFTDAETAGMAQTYFIPGKASYGEYDKMLGLKTLGQLKDGDDVKMGNLLIQGYDYFQKALPLDPVTDAKGKTKTKYTKDMIGTMSSHFADYSSAGVDMFNAQDYKGAYQLWNIFNKMGETPEIVAKLNNVPADTVFGEIYYNQALAAWQAEMLPEALAAFKGAESKGYTKKPLYDYAIAVATNLQDADAVLDFAKRGLALYGKEDPMYMGQVVNYYLQKKDFDTAFSVINDAIAADPDNAQYYVIQGVLYENQEKRDQAKAAYLKAVELDPNNPQAQANYGYSICNDAYVLAEQSPINQAEYDKYYNETLRPVFEQAAQVLERAYELDNENMDVLKYLENIYYNLHDEAKLQDVKNRML
ncbi:MAG: tetratricopeptide repeat protein [Bacteroidales bacterium]|nr:tetratricopeptide repeat protein [Bacteroidales bacterium]